MKLSETVVLMNSTEYKERFIAEYLQLKIRIEGLKSMLAKYALGTLPFKPTCSYDLLNAQLRSMTMYAQCLEDRAHVESICLV